MIERLVGYGLVASICGGFLGLANSLTFKTEWVGITCAAIVAPGLFLAVCYMIYLIIDGLKNG